MADKKFFLSTKKSYKLSMIAGGYNSSTQEPKVGIKSLRPALHVEFKDTLGYIVRRRGVKEGEEVDEEEDKGSPRSFPLSTPLTYKFTQIKKLP